MLSTRLAIAQRPLRRSGCPEDSWSHGGSPSTQAGTTQPSTREPRPWTLCSDSWAVLKGLWEAKGWVTMTKPGWDGALPLTRSNRLMRRQTACPVCTNQCPRQLPSSKFPSDKLARACLCLCVPESSLPCHHANQTASTRGLEKVCATHRAWCVPPTEGRGQRSEVTMRQIGEERDTGWRSQLLIIRRHRVGGGRRGVESKLTGEPWQPVAPLYRPRLHVFQLVALLPM